MLLGLKASSVCDFMVERLVGSGLRKLHHFSRILQARSLPLRDLYDGKEDSEQRPVTAPYKGFGLVETDLVEREIDNKRL